MTDDVNGAVQARALMYGRSYGILSTHSLDMPGYPFGSVAPYAIDREGFPVILISTLAQHTKNIMHNPKISLLVYEADHTDVQAHGRVTVLAEAERMNKTSPDTAERYYRRFPQSNHFHETHDFSFYRLRVARVRFIGGFGNICWITADSFVQSNPFSAEDERRILDHMNKDHKNALRYYGMQQLSLPWDEDTDVSMISIDREGFDLLSEGRIRRVTFPTPVLNVEAARDALAGMARKGT